MAISYNIYTNDGRGGDVIYAAPIATTTGLTYSVGLLARPSDNTFAVRAFDSVSGVEEANTDARVRVVIDPSGDDVTAQPNAILGLSARPTAGGTCWVAWGYNATGQGGPPSEFNVTLTPGPIPMLTNPLATVGYVPGVVGYGCSLSGLASNTLSTIAVQAVGAPGSPPGPASTVAIDYKVNSLSNVDSLAGVPSP